METISLSHWYQEQQYHSPLAGESNWMETSAGDEIAMDFVAFSPLAGESNWMETIDSIFFLLFLRAEPPHSLGKVIEWKLAFYLDTIATSAPSTPHSLGKVIEWKPVINSSLLICYKLFTPHSLGKVIEWKLVVVVRVVRTVTAPHSLGKVIEWKPSIPPVDLHLHNHPLPTRWGK